MTELAPHLTRVSNIPWLTFHTVSLKPSYRCSLAIKTNANKHKIGEKQQATAVEFVCSYRVMHVIVVDIGRLGITGSPEQR